MGDEFERLNVTRANDWEVAMIDGGDSFDSVSFGESEERRVGHTEG